MFIAAFKSLSRISPHSLQIHFLLFKVKLLFFHPHLLQVLLEGKNLFILITDLSFHSALYFKVSINLPQEISEIDLFNPFFFD
jgi:hypothetical protein